MNAKELTNAPLRHRMRVELRAPLSDVWALTGDHARLAEYSAGIARVDVTPGARICHFHPREEGAPPLSVREIIRWEEPGRGYAVSAEQGNDFGLTDDLSFVTVEPLDGGTLFTWEQYYEHPDLTVMRAGFQEGIIDIGQRLAARFGGRIVEQFVDGPMA